MLYTCILRVKCEKLKCEFDDSTLAFRVDEDR